MKGLKKIVLILLITCILVTSMPIYALEKIVNTVNGKEDWDNALHFIVRHWHSTYEENDDSQESVIVEGYIVPKGKEYAIYTGEGGNQKQLSDDEKTDSDYIDSIDSKNGTITLKASPLKHKDGTPLESFSAFSITSGNKSIKIEDENEGKVVISYHPYVHLVKIHTFYDNESLKVVGSGSDDAVFGSSETQTNAEQDVAWVYTYIKAEGDNKVGDVVKNNGKPVYEKKDLPGNLTVGKDVELTKVYSTLEGLHTDKTANSVNGNDREFTIDLETWYSGAKAADVGLVLDASGSMIFTSDALEPIQLDEKEIEEFKLKDKMLSKDKYEEGKGPSTNAWNHDIFLTQAEVNEILNVHNTDNNPLGNSGYNYYVFNESTDVNEYAPLGYWDGSLNDELYDSVIGYYEFNKGDYDKTSDENRRDWLKNSASDSDGEASVVKQISKDDLNEKKDISFESVKSPSDWGNDKRIKMDPTNGLTVKDLNSSEGVETSLGVLLDAKPTTNNFTISFTVKKKDKEGEKPKAEADLIYIGPLENIDSSDYYRVYRDENSSSNRLKMDEISSNTTKGNKTSINNVFKDENKTCTITLVFEDGKINSYKDGSLDTTIQDGKNNQEIDLTERNIVLTGIDNNYSGSDLYIDNVCVFDTALSSDDVKRISFSAKEAAEEEYLAYNTFEEDEKDKAVKAGETAGNGEIEEKIGLTDKYFVDPVTGGMSGWYYINHDSDLAKHYFENTIETGKILWGVNNADTKENITYTEKIKIPTGVKAEHTDTEFTYKPNENSPTLFYIDGNGYLCCFFTRGTKQKTVGTSLVYEKEDSEYIKAEALQRALGSFASELNEASPYSEISAVRYSSDKAKEEEYDKFVLLDWTNDPTDVQDMMSLTYGNGGTTKGTESDHESTDGKKITQYNYGVTGGTATYVGIKAFEKFLKDGVNKDADKYLIIFTDGKDTSGEEKQKEITEEVKKLKEQGYTIMAVMLTGGSIEYSTDEGSEYKTAKDFLLKLVGTSETEESKEEEKEQYFFSTAEVGLSDGEKSDKEEVDTIDTLTEIFTEDILERISDNLEAYNVQDYIDPRFNLISADGKEYKLDANGIVTILDNDGKTYAKYDLKKGEIEKKVEENEILASDGNDSDKKYYLSVKLSDDSDVDIATRNARLYFDKENNMYYLKWVNQTIPGCVVNAKILPVWNTRFTIKAKDDVIVGNAVLTNGNKEKMNYVYNKDDNNASSGTDKWKQEKDEDSYVSKGFPRVTVNIPVRKLETTGSQTIYMGEELNYKTIKEKMIKEVREDIKDTKKDIWYYWEYLERYAKHRGEKGEEVKADYYIDKMLDKYQVKIPYYYLPNEENTNLTGSEKHKEDLLGFLIYEIKEERPDDNDKEIEIVKDRTKRKLTLTVTYEPLDIEKSEGKEETETTGELEVFEEKDETKDRLEANKDLVEESNYKWDKKYKPAVGKLIETEEVIKNTHTIDIVSGEVALQVILNRDILEILYDQPIQYEIDLYRTYNDKKEKVGTFKATYDSKSNSELKPDKDGNITVTAKLQYDEDYMNTNGLPLGTYTLENQKIEGLKNIKYDTINVVKEEARYTDKLFSLGTNHETPTSYLAVLGEETNITLGKKDDGDKYLEERFGLFEVKPIAVFEMPDAGSNALIMHYVISGLCIVTATILHQSLKIRRKKRK